MTPIGTYPFHQLQGSQINPTSPGVHLTGQVVGIWWLSQHLRAAHYSGIARAEKEDIFQKFVPWVWHEVQQIRKGSTFWYFFFNESL